MIPALREASLDPELRGAPLSVYLILVFELDADAFKPVKQAALALRLELTERSVREATRVLEERGYIEAGESRPGESRTFRLFDNRKRNAPPSQQRGV